MFGGGGGCLRTGAVSEYTFNQHTQLAVLIVCVELQKASTQIWLKSSPNTLASCACAQRERERERDVSICICIPQRESVEFPWPVLQMEMLTQKQNGTVGGAEESEEQEQEEKKEHTATIKGLWKKAFKSLKSGGDQKWSVSRESG